MEVPPGRVEQISDGGPEAIRALLAELRAMKFNGLLKTSVVRGETPAEGVLVLRGGDGVLAEHRSEVDVTGADAVLEILKDAASEKSKLEVRTYDYGHSRISIDQLQRSYPEASVPGLGDADEVLSQAIARGPRNEKRTFRTSETAGTQSGGLSTTRNPSGTASGNLSGRLGRAGLARRNWSPCARSWRRSNRPAAS